LHKGFRLENYELVRAPFTSWHPITLAMFTTALPQELQYGSGLCALVSYGTAYFGPAQLMYPSSIAAACAVCVPFIRCRRLYDEQSAAWAHWLQTLVDLIDGWKHAAIYYWSQKPEKCNLCYTEIFGSSLAGIQVRLEYAGTRVSIDQQSSFDEW